MRRLIAVFSLCCIGRVVRAQDSRLEISGLPALNFDADEGVGYGVVLALYKYDGNRSTYRWTVQPQVLFTTEGRRDATLFFDAPSGSGHPWRTTAFVGHEQQLAAPYYGIGNSTAYSADVEHGSTRYFYRYGRVRDRAALDFQHTLGKPTLRGLIGAGVSIDAIDLTPFDSGTTLIQEDLNNVTPAKGHTNFLRVGLTWDSRDREIGTQTGTWADILVQRVDKKLGASSNYTRVTGTARNYLPITGRLVLANRLLVQNVNGDAPFYALSEVQTTQKPDDGLGGASTVRGLPKDRYVGKGLAIANNELRWRALDFRLLGRPSSIVLSSFVDAGRVWSDRLELSSVFDELHVGYGAGGRLALGQSFVIAGDIGHSSQSTAAVYIGLGYLF